MNGANILERLKEQNPDVALILDAYDAIEQVYNAGLRAMGVGGRPATQTGDSAQFRYSIEPSSPTIKIEE